MVQEIIIPLITLISLEVILGIDNIIFISILADKLPEEKRQRFRYIGMGLAVLMRLVLLGAISWIIKLDATVFQWKGLDLSGKDLILIAGGLFLLYKSVREIYYKTEAEPEGHAFEAAGHSFRQLIYQVILLDMVFSVDSIITAVGMVSELWIMYTAVIISVTIMIFAMKPISEVITRHPSLKVLALCFLLLIGIALIAEGLDFLIPKGYIYFSMAFAFLVDIIQIRVEAIRKRKKQAPPIK